ncbi:hypothetical protein MLP_15070 [Microlunatus phosphovorus NM-1]|uniref:Uncharacterized protein n=1 Tax=Microlunatus phosphovorus (strain ATCC 700054 / DSM 10555 / JCM 9379 / NBRC 101784 / NCIMB 13414 / VKM Ac-1990 / NM-1) TaxID=1032480 RepID=F5XQM1_MICPN|nr:hypothetical protein MLP_15070 [Microlunatus phosphovorus NM-1]
MGMPMRTRQVVAAPQELVSANAVVIVLIVCGLWAPDTLNRRSSVSHGRKTSGRAAGAQLSWAAS